MCHHPYDMQPPSLVARGLHKSFKGLVAVDDLDLVVGQGERVGLLGPNGAGKTTTLLMLLGAVHPDRGEIEVVGHPMPRHRSRAMESVGFVAGYLPLPESLTVRESLEVFAGFSRVRNSREVVEEAAADFDLSDLIDKKNQELSSGQRTLVSIVKAVLHRPRLLFLDEPTASLDPDMAVRVRQALLRIHARDGSAMLVTSHNMREVEMLCERVVLMSLGRIVADGAPAEIAAQFEVEDLEGAFMVVAARLRGERPA